MFHFNFHSDSDFLMKEVTIKYQYFQDLVTDRVNSLVLQGLQGSCGSADTIPLILNPIFARVARRVSQCTIYLPIVLVLAVRPHPSQLSHRFKPGPPERSALRTQTSDTNYIAAAAGRLGTCKHDQPLFPLSGCRISFSLLPPNSSGQCYRFFFSEIF